MLLRDVDFWAIIMKTTGTYFQLFGIYMCFIFGTIAEFKGLPAWRRYTQAAMVLLVIAAIYGIMYDGTVCTDYEGDPRGGCVYYETIDENVTSTEQFEKGLWLFIFAAP